MVPVNSDGVLDLKKGTFSVPFFNGLHGVCGCDNAPSDTGTLSIFSKRSAQPTALLSIEQRYADSKIRIREEIGHSRFRKSYRRRSDSPPKILGKRVSAAWTAAAARGAANYEKWKAKTGPDVPPPCDYEKEYNMDQYSLVPVSRTPNILTLYQNLGIDTSIKSYNTMVTWPAGDGPTADYNNLFGPQNGIIDARSNNKGEGATQDTNGWSELAWYLWKKSCVSVTPGTTDFSGLKWFFRSNIDNPTTVQILSEVFDGVKENDPVKFTPDNPDQTTNAFWALLGSPNGYGANRMCTDHKLALGGKGVVSMNAMWITGGDSFIWAEIG